MQNADRINLSEEYRNSLCGEAARAANRIEQHTIYLNALMASTVVCLSVIQKVKTQHAPAKPAGSMAQSERLPQLYAPFCNNTSGLVSVEMSTANSQSNEPADTPVGNDGNNATTHVGPPVTETSPANPYQSKNFLGSPMTAQIL
jgi:hypothetical protein